MITLVNRGEIEVDVLVEDDVVGKIVREDDVFHFYFEGEVESAASFATVIEAINCLGVMLGDGRVN